MYKTLCIKSIHNLWFGQLCMFSAQDDNPGVFLAITFHLEQHHWQVGVGKKKVRCMKKIWRYHHSARRGARVLE